ncbi:MAG: succinate dehydrogenase [bacterium]
MFRRIHSLTGILPMGLYLFEHFFTNSFSWQGRAAYNAKVDFLRSMPYLFGIEMGLIFIPFGFHILYGWYIMLSNQPNIIRYPYARNWMYYFQRVSAIFVFFFIVFHVWTLRFAHDPDVLDFYFLLSTLFADPLFVTVYVIGVAATVFHFCNGLCTFCMTWGITVGPTSQRWVARGAIALGVIMGIVAVRSIFGFVDPVAEGLVL